MTFPPRRFRVDRPLLTLCDRPEVLRRRALTDHSPRGVHAPRSGHGREGLRVVAPGNPGTGLNVVVVAVDTGGTVAAADQRGNP